MMMIIIITIIITITMPSDKNKEINTYELCK